MHLTLLTLLVAGTSAQFVPNVVPQVAHAYGLEGPGEWHPINNQNTGSRPTPTPSTMISMASGVKPSIKPMASSLPYAAGMFAPNSAAHSHGYAHGHSHGYAAHHATPSASHYFMATPRPTHRPSHALYQHQAPAPSSTPVGHGPAVVPDGHVGVPAGGMGVPPSAEAPEPLNAAPDSEGMYAGKQSDIAPINPLAPGTNVAPVQVHHKFGADEGNSFCLGQCFASAEEAQCGPPYGAAVLKAPGCYTCCFSAQDF